MSKRRLPELAVFGFLFPNFAGFLVFMLFPILLCLVMAFTNWSLRPAMEFEFLGLRNFTDLLGVRALEKGHTGLAAFYIAGVLALFLGLVGTLWGNVSQWRGARIGGAVLAVLGLGALVQKGVAVALGAYGMEAVLAMPRLGLVLGLGGGQGILIAAVILLAGGIAIMCREDADWHFGFGTVPAMLLTAGILVLWIAHVPMWTAYEPSDARFWRFSYNTLYLMLGLPFSIVGSLALALLLNNTMPLGRWRMRAIGALLCLVCGAVTVLLVWNLGKSWMVFPDDLRDPAALAARLRDAPDPVSRHLRDGFSEETRSLLAAYDPAQAPSVELQGALVGELNRAVQDASLYDAKRFEGIELRDETGELLARPVARPKQALQRNRMLLEDAYPMILARTQRLGHPNLALLGGILWFMAALGMAFNVVAFRTLFYVPMFTSGVALMILWKALYNPETGPINLGMLAMLEAVGVAPDMAKDWMPQWLGSVAWAKPALIFMGIWTFIGGTNMLLYLAGLSNVPRSLLDAAEVDGAGAWAQFRHVTWPQLAPTTFFISVMAVIVGLQSGFEQARVMTEGGPAGSTTTLSYYIYNKFFWDLDLGYAAAISWVLFAVIFIATAINWKSGKSLEVSL